MKTLDYFRRFFATLFGFILFGVAGVLFKIALLPYTLKSTKGDIKRQLEARRMIGKVWRFFVGYLQWSGVLSVRFNGLEKLGRPGQLILANHPSLLDVVLLISHYSEPNVLVKKDLLHNPSMKSQIIASGYIPNDESMEMLEEIDAVFKSGQSLLIFPEGTRNLGDELLQFKSGIYHLAREWPQVEFVPVWLENLHRVMPKGHVIPLPLLCTVNFGAPVLMQTDDAMDAKTLYLQRCRDALQALKPVRD